MKIDKWAHKGLKLSYSLMAFARNRQDIQYGPAATDILGFEKGGSAISHPLGYVMSVCEDLELPHLTVLVVKPVTGRPDPDGLHWVKPEDVDEMRERVFGYPWHRVQLTVEQLQTSHNRAVHVRWDLAEFRRTRGLIFVPTRPIVEASASRGQQ
jgi:hypothetical protein